jgi:hypothetical protein
MTAEREQVGENSSESVPSLRPEALAPSSDALTAEPGLSNRAASALAAHVPTRPGGGAASSHPEADITRLAARLAASSGNRAAACFVASARSNGGGRRTLAREQRAPPSTSQDNPALRDIRERGARQLAEAVSRRANVDPLSRPRLAAQTIAVQRDPLVCDPTVSSCAPGTVAPDGTPNLVANPDSDDFKAGFHDATLGSGEPDRGSRTGQAQVNYDAGFAAGMATIQQPSPSPDTPAPAADPAPSPPAPAVDLTPSMDLTQRLLKMLDHAGDALGPQGVARLKELTSPEALAALAAFIGAQFAGLGEAADAVGIVALAFKIGGDAVTVAKDLGACFLITFNATTDKELTEAGQRLAHAVTLAGVDLILAFLAAKGGEGEGEAGGEGEGKGSKGTGEGEGKGTGEGEGAGKGGPIEEVPEGVTDEDVHIEDVAEDKAPDPGVPDPVMTPAMCFPAGTLVHTPAGPRAIESVAVGDLVLAWQEETSTVQGRPVTDVIQGSTRSWVDVELVGVATVRSTPSHPFWVEPERGWIAAGKLVAGMSVRLCDGRLIEVRRARQIAVDDSPTFNLSVEEHSNFFVGDGVLVHNVKLKMSRYNRLNRGGFRNYLLRAGGPRGKPYYSGMFGPKQDPVQVAARHARNHNRFDPETDFLDVQPGTRTYGEARVMENDLANQNDTVIGRDGDNFRGNREQPLADDKLPEYEEFLKIKAGGECG